MSYMFYSASAFNQNLCSWAQTFPYNKAVGIFALLNCTFTVGPVSEKCGLFCASECSIGLNQCFANKAELKQAIDEYAAKDCANVPNCTLGGGTHGVFPT